jgi:hypothetical protein
MCGSKTQAGRFCRKATKDALRCGTGPVCATEHLHGTCDLGRGDERDITLKGLDAIQRSSRVYLEAYTSILGVSHDKLVSCAF